MYTVFPIKLLLNVIFAELFWFNELGQKCIPTFFFSLGLNIKDDKQT